MVRRMKTFDRIAFAILIFLLPAIAHADIIWPSLYVEQGILTWWVILLGLLLEVPLFKLATGAPWVRAAIITVIANTVSTLLGLVLIPISGLGWELSAGQVVNTVLHVGTFNWVTWVASFALAIGINTCIEGFVLTRLRATLPSDQHVRRGTPLKRTWPWLALANVLSVGLAVVAVYFQWISR